MSEALVTVTIPTYDQRPEYLADAINSVLAQSVPVELVVVDDGSTVPVPHEDCPANVRVLRHAENRGISAALNTGIEATRTPWWCWLSSDDIFTADKVEQQLAQTIAAGQQASHHGYFTFQTGKRPERAVQVVRWRTMEAQQVYLARTCMVNGSTVMLHRSVFREVGLFDESFRYGQDWEMWCRIGRRYFWFGIPQVLGSRREDGVNLTKSIESDPARRAVRDAEDDLIRERFRVGC